MRLKSAKASSAFYVDSIANIWYGIIGLCGRKLSCSNKTTSKNMCSTCGETICSKKQVLHSNFCRRIIDDEDTCQCLAQA